MILKVSLLHCRSVCSAHCYSLSHALSHSHTEHQKHLEKPHTCWCPVKTSISFTVLCSRPEFRIHSIGSTFALGIHKQTVYCVHCTVYTALSSLAPALDCWSVLCMPFPIIFPICLQKYPCGPSVVYHIELRCVSLSVVCSLFIKLARVCVCMCVTVFLSVLT